MTDGPKNLYQLYQRTHSFSGIQVRVVAIKVANLINPKDILLSMLADRDSTVRKHAGRKFFLFRKTNVDQARPSVNILYLVGPKFNSRAKSFYVMVL